MKFFVLVFSFFICVKPSFAENGLAQGVQCEQQIISLIDQAKRQIDIAVYSFNRQSIIEALVKARQRGVEIRLMTDRSQLAASKNMEDISRLLNSGVDVRVSTHKKGLMHTKMAIFDGKHAVSGSFNWTNAAVENNYEVCNIFKNDESYAGLHLKMFNRIWEENSKSKSDGWLRMKGYCGNFLLLRT